jgi:hypothetical protein
LAPHTVEEYIVQELVKDSANYDLIRNYLERLDKERIIELFERHLDKTSAEVRIPLSVLSNRVLSSLEATIKFLRENLGLSNSVVAALVGRSAQVCWTTYHNACQKYPGRLDATQSRYDVPVSIIRDKGLSVLESIIVYLHEQFELSFSEIARILNRDARTVWTVVHRALLKRGGQ